MLIREQELHAGCSVTHVLARHSLCLELQPDRKGRFPASQIFGILKINVPILHCDELGGRKLEQENDRQ